MTAGPRTRVAGRGGLGAAALLLPLLTACGGGAASSASPSASPSTSVPGADVGALQIRDARIPQPASPDVAAAYLTIVNTGGTPDALIRASTPAAASVSLHSTTDSAGVEQMVPLASLPIPAHGTVALTVGQRHLMLMNPPRALRAGDTVTLTLVFRRAGTVSVSVPVVPLTGFGASPESSSGDMANMPGMG